MLVGDLLSDAELFGAMYGPVDVWAGRRSLALSGGLAQPSLSVFFTNDPLRPALVGSIFDALVPFADAPETHVTA
jgi:hypothetical protein